MLFGAHVSAAGGISNAIDRIEAIGGNAVQVFTQSPRMWRPTAHSEEQLERFRVRRRQARVRHVSCHALYLVNLASRDKEIRSKSFDALQATMETAREIQADAVVFHVGSHLGYGFEEAVKIVTIRLGGPRDGDPMGVLVVRLAENGVDLLPESEHPDEAVSGMSRA